MARSEARLQIDLWREGLDGLGAHAKLMYCVLLTEPTLNHAGVGAVRESRWARNASLTAAEAGKALEELTDTGHVVIDEDTEELLVRTLIRRDGVADQPYVLKGALKAALAAKSPHIRWVLAQELRKLPPKRPDGMSKAGKKVVYPDPHAAADVLAPPGSQPPPDTHPRATRHPSETLFEGSVEGLDTHPSEKGLDTHSKGKGEGEGEGDISSSVATSVTRTAGAQPRADAASADTKIAQEITRAYAERVPLSKFPAVLGIVRRALKANYPPDAVKAALLRLADERRPVTVDSLRVELEGLPAPRNTARPRTADDKIAALQAMKTGNGGISNVIALPRGAVQ